MSTATTSVPTGSWRSDPVHSQVGFAVKHMGVATFRGSFARFEAGLCNSGAGPELRGTAHVDSVDVRDQDLRAHLLSPEFFDAERHPALTFASRRLREEDGALVLEGDLTIKGRTRPVEARGTITGPLEDAAGGERVGLQLEATVDRTEFGLDWNAPLPRGGFALADDVRLAVHLVLTREDA